MKCFLWHVFCAPCAGIFIIDENSIKTGSIVKPGMVIGQVQTRTKIQGPKGTNLAMSSQVFRYTGVAGKVVKQFTHSGWEVVEDQPLFAIQVLSEEELAEAEKEFVLASETDGRFYQGPSPNDPPYIKVGDKILHGAQYGLAEKMKVFNHLIYPDDAPEGVVTWIAPDTSAIQIGSPLIKVKR